MPREKNFPAALRVLGLAHDSSFELCEDTTHVKHRAPGRRRGVERLSVQVQIAADGLRILKAAAEGVSIRTFSFPICALSSESKSPTFPA
jgi:hypothetical protein